ncbi:Uncharacterized protein FWK35_00006014, partial [Aphis craccivora]
AHDELFQILEDDSELDSLIEQFENVSITYIRVKSNFKSMLADKNVTDVHEVDKHIKLSSINLPQFSGMFEEWFSFKHQFEAIVHNYANIENTQKMHYLKSGLKLWTTDHLCHVAPPDWESLRQLGSIVIFPNLVVRRTAGGLWSTVHMCKTVPSFLETDYSPD